MFLKNWLFRRPLRRRGTVFPRSSLRLELLEPRDVPAVSFSKSLLTGAVPINPTSLQFGPDSRLYVAQQTGEINIYTVARSAVNSYAVTQAEVINLVHDIPNHNDDGTLNPAVTGRQVTGILVTGSAANPVVYVTSSDPRIGGGSAGTNTNLDTNSGILSRLTWTGTAWTKLDLVRGLPRSEENHSSNGMALDATTNTLYIGQAGHTNMGAPSNNFAYQPEYALSAAILSVNLNAIGNTTYNLPTLVDDTAQVNLNDPFGGDNGKNQAIIVLGGPVQVYSSGYRNPYDVVLTANGRMFTFDNGSNAGWGDVPLDASGKKTTATTAGNATNAVSEPGVTDPDQLTRVTAGFYAGHPNPTRANKANTFNPLNPQSPVLTANPVEGYYLTPGVSDGALATVGASTNGITEYTAGNFGGEMTGDLLAAAFDNTIYRFKLNATGDAVLAQTALFSNVGQLPLDVTTLSSGPLAGTIWVADYLANSVVVFEPADLNGTSPTGTGANDPTLDDDKDGYSNRDEIANGTNPGSGADVPPDFSKNFVSDKLDPNDDSDGLPDVNDPFARDAANGRNTNLPVLYPWDNASPYPGGLLNLGFTGLMTNGTTDYLQQFDTTKLTAGGAAGALTIDSVTAGTAKGSANNQDNGFQFGINATASTAPFTVHTKVKNPFAGVTPQAGQQIGLQFGTGGQDNYLELAIDGDGSVKLMKEVGGAWAVIASTPVALAGASDIDLFITIDPATGSAKGGFTVLSGGLTGPLKAVGSTTVPTGWFSATTAPAVGVMTTNGGNATFSATYDLMEVVNAWTSGPNLPVALGEVAGGIINGKLYLVGEGDARTFAYDLSAKTWSAPLATRRFVGNHHTAEVVGGRLYLFGGLGGGSDGTVQIYDPATNAWSLGAPMPFAAGSVSTALIAGQVYIAGGIVGTSTTTQAAKYDPASNIWTAIAPMSQGRNHAASGTDGSKFYVIGGRDGANVVSNGYATVQVYNPATNTWASSLDAGSTIPPLPQARGGMGKAVFANGEFYVIGGETLTGSGATATNVYDRVDVYTLATQTWRQAVSLPTARHGIFPLLGTTPQGGTAIFVAGGGVQASASVSAVLETLLVTAPASPAPTLPAAPTGLTAQGALPTRVILNWQDNSNNETGFQIERKTGAGTFVLLGRVGTGVISYTDVTGVAGTAYTYRVTATNAAGISAATNEATATAPVLTNTSFNGTPWAVGTTIEAENFDFGGEGVAFHDNTVANEGAAYRTDGVDIEPSTDTGGGFNVGYIQAGEWIEYTLSVPTAGAYTLEVRVASSAVGGTFHVEVEGVNKTGTLTVPSTGGWQTWQTLSVPIQLVAGQSVVRFAFDTASPTTGYVANLNWFRVTAAAAQAPYGGTPWAIGATVQAENYDTGGEGVAFHDNTTANAGGAYRTDGVDIEPSTDTGGGFNVGYIKAGEWIEYTLSVPSAGAYVLEIRVASVVAGGTFHVEVDGVNKTGTLTMPNTGGWQTWQTLSIPVQLVAGRSVVRFAFDTASPTTGYVGNLNWFRVTAASVVPAAPSALTATDTGTAVNLRWADNSSNETGFVIQRATGTSAFTTLATVTGGVTTYSDPTALASALYTYRVAAISTAGNSGFSNPVAITTSAAQIIISDVTQTAGTGTGTISFVFTVTLSRASAQKVTVKYATTDGTAKARTDYTATSGTLTFNPGQTSKTISVKVNRFLTVKPSRIFYLDLFAPVNGVLTKSRGMGTIL